MSSSIQISLRAGERFYLNGAVLRADRKVTLELMNEATFLLEHHVMQSEGATTPLRQLYFVIQTMLIEPTKAEEARGLFERFHELLQTSFKCAAVVAGLERVHQLVAADRAFEALKTLRVLFPIEDDIMTAGEIHAPPVDAHNAEAI